MIFGSLWKNGPYVPKHLTGGVVERKPRDICTKEDK